VRGYIVPRASAPAVDASFNFLSHLSLLAQSDVVVNLGLSKFCFAAST
jgi:hypothetical protein